MNRCASNPASFCFKTCVRLIALSAIKFLNRNDCAGTVEDKQFYDDLKLLDPFQVFIHVDRWNGAEWLKRFEK